MGAGAFTVNAARSREGAMDMILDAGATVTRLGALDMQVCVPEGWDDGAVKAFADRENPCGTDGGWSIRTDPALLAGDPVRQPCHSRAGFVHVMLDA